MRIKEKKLHEFPSNVLFEAASKFLNAGEIDQLEVHFNKTSACLSCVIGLDLKTNKPKFIHYTLYDVINELSRRGNIYDSLTERDKPLQTVKPQTSIEWLNEYCGILRSNNIKFSTRGYEMIALDLEEKAKAEEILDIIRKHLSIVKPINDTMLIFDIDLWNTGKQKDDFEKVKEYFDL